MLADKRVRWLAWLVKRYELTDAQWDRICERSDTASSRSIIGSKRVFRGTCVVVR